MSTAESDQRPEGDDLDGVEPASIDLPDEPETPLEKLQAKARRFSPERVRGIVEGLLLVSDKPLTLDAIERASGIAPEQARDAFDKLGGTYREGVCGLVLHEVAGGWQLRTAPETAEFVRRLLQVKPQRLTRAALETLAIIAYRQPVTRPEIEDIRAVDCGAVVKALLERKLIKILGKKEEPGRPILYGTSREFLEFFNLKDLASLPTLREFQELSEEHQAIVEKEAPPPVQGTVSQLADPAFLARQKAKAQASEEALADLEAAMRDAEAKVKVTEQVLTPGKPQPGGEELADEPA